jgi:hypothetical protein
VSFQVQDKSADTWQESDGWPLFILLDIPLGEVVRKGERNVWEEGKEVFCCLPFSCGCDRMISREVD